MSTRVNRNHQNHTVAPSTCFSPFERKLVSQRYVRTIARDATIELDIRRSRFIGRCFRVDNEQAAREITERIRKQEWEANHNCTVWRLGPRGDVQRSSDDGEPAGTAGIPILEVLIHRDLTDVLVIVTRYFGGIKLGAGGLIRAYGSTCSAVLDAAGVVERKPLHRIVAEVDHAAAGRFENLLRSTDFALADVDYTASGVEFAVHLSPEDVTIFDDWVAAATSGAATTVDLGTFEVEVPVTSEAVSGSIE